jgi:cytochrome c biogenesis protein CcdA
MVRECEICGRTIKSGRKYCWEHRHTAQAEGLNSMKKLENSYFKHRLKEKFGIIGKILFSIGSLIVGICAIFLIFSFMVMFIGKLDYNKFYTILIIGGIVFIAMLSFEWKIKREIRKEIVYRSKEFIEYAKAYGEMIKEDREFRKSIFH